MTVYSFKKFHYDHSLVIKRIDKILVIMVVYVIILLRNNKQEILLTKEYLKKHFVTKDLR